METVLVTGGAGFIGSCFVRHLLESDADVRVVTLDALTYAGSLENLKDLPNPDRHVFVQADICNQAAIEDILREYRPEAVVHLAAESHVDRSISSPAQFVQTNILGTYNLLEACRHAWTVYGGLDRSRLRFHHVSTDEVFGSLGPEDRPFSESSPYAPNSPYAASKAASDHLVRSYMRTYAFPAVITNCSNNYGPYQFPEKLIPLIILNALEGKSLPVYGDGGQVRDWVFVEDHCQAMALVLRHGTTFETYNIGGENQSTNLEVVKQICVIMDEARPDSPWVPHRSLIQLVSDRPGHDRRYAMNIRKIQAELGWSPRHTLSEGLRKTVEWFLSHQEWVETRRNNPEYLRWLQVNYASRGRAGGG
jgi:dTDP-glucose 4,6-dehydratase